MPRRKQIDFSDSDAELDNDAHGEDKELGHHDQSGSQEDASSRVSPDLLDALEGHSPSPGPPQGDRAADAETKGAGPTSEREPAPDQGSSETKSTILRLPRASLGGHPPRKKSEMDWLHGRHPSQLQEGGSSSNSKQPSVLAPASKGASLAGWPSQPLPSTSRSVESGETVKAEEDKPNDSEWSSRPPEARPKAKRTKQQRPISTTSVERFYGPSSHANTSIGRDPFGSEDDEAETSVAKAGSPPVEANSQPKPRTIKLIHPTMPPILKPGQIAGGSVDGSETGAAPSLQGTPGEGASKKKKRTNKKKGEVGPGKAWRKGLKDVDRLAGRTPGTVSVGSSAEPQAAPPNAKKRKQADLIPLPPPGRPKPSRKGSSFAELVGEIYADDVVSSSPDPDVELAELVDDLDRRRKRQGTPGSSDVDMEDVSKARSAARGHPVPPPLVPAARGLSREELRAPATPEKLGHPVYRGHIPGKAIPVYRIPSPVRVKEKELAVPTPIRDQLGPPPRSWQIGTRIVLGVGGAHIRLKSWMSTGHSQFAAHKQAQAEAARLAQAQAMYQQQQQQLLAGQQAAFDTAPYGGGITGWTNGPPGPVPPPMQGSSPYPMDYSSHAPPHPLLPYPGAQQFVNQLSPLPLPSGQSSPAQLPFQPVVPDRGALYQGGTSVLPPKQAKPKRKKPPTGTAAKGKLGKAKLDAASDFSPQPSGPNTPMPLGASSPIPLPAASTSTAPFPAARHDDFAHAPAAAEMSREFTHSTSESSVTQQLHPPPLPPIAKTPTTKAKAKGKKKSRASTLSRPVLDDSESDQLAGSAGMAKQESGDSLDKEMEDLL